MNASNTSNIQIQIGKINAIQGEFLEKIGRILAKRAEVNGRISNAKIDENQSIHYNYAHHSAEHKIAQHFERYAKDCAQSLASTLEPRMAWIFAGESLSRLRAEISGRYLEYGLRPEELAPLFSPEAHKLIQNAIAKENYDRVAEEILQNNKFGHLALSQDHLELRDTFRSFAEEVVAPKAEEVHTKDSFVPQEILEGLADMGAFGIAIPDKYAGFLDAYGNIGMMIVTEELSRGGLSIAGSLITRPEILSKALLKGGTEAQKEKWLPALASGEKLNSVAVTEPNYGSDVANMQVSATKTQGGWLISGVKTWCTFAGYADLVMVLARTEADPSLRHKGLSILLAEKPRDKGHRFEFDQKDIHQPGKISGSAIPTIGYRGMHSFEVSFEEYFVPDENLIGGEAGRGKGFYLQMAGFAGGRIQTAARANGVMQAAMEAGCRYALERKVFGKEIAAYQLSKWKIARMAMITQASRQYSLYAAQLMDQGKGSLEATLIKFYASRISEWVTREAMQLHGGMGYAEEYAVSRYFLDSRVFSIFEGAEEVMALRVCARELLARFL